MKPISSGDKVFFPNLDGLRTLAFLFVFYLHGFSLSLEQLAISNDFLNRLVFKVATGSSGVSIFFVLSGFLITYLLLKEVNERGTLNVGFFYVRRVLRIWPLYFVSVIFAFIIYPYIKTLLGIHQEPAARPLYYFTFLSNFDAIYVHKFFPGQSNPVEAITWSVAIEEQFYIVWPLLFFFIPKKYYKFIFIGAILVSMTFRFLHKNENWTLYFHSLSVTLDLAMGGLAAYYSIYSKKFLQFFKSLSRSVIVAVYIIGFVWLLYQDKILGPNLYPVFYRPINTAFFAFVILEQNFSSNSFYKFSKFRLMTFWGKYTYGLYLLHVIALLACDIIFRKVFPNYGEQFFLSLLMGIIALLLSMGISYVSYEFFEKRFLKLKDKFKFIHGHDIKAKTAVQGE